MSEHTKSMSEHIQSESEHTEYLHRIAVSLESIARAMAPQHPPDYQHDLSDFPNFDWTSIGATVTRRDRFGATAVSWGGHIYTRRSPQNKFDVAIWFSRCTGKQSDGSNAYERLITFKRTPAVEPLPERVSMQLATGFNQRRDRAWS